MGQRAQREEAGSGQEEGAEDRGGNRCRFSSPENTAAPQNSLKASVIRRVKTMSRVERKSSQGVGWIHRFVGTRPCSLRSKSRESSFKRLLFF